MHNNIQPQLNYCDLGKFENSAPLYMVFGIIKTAAQNQFENSQFHLIYQAKFYLHNFLIPVD